MQIWTLNNAGLELHHPTTLPPTPDENHAVPAFTYLTVAWSDTNLNLMAQCNLLLTLSWAFPVQPTINTEAGLPSATYC